MSSAKNRGGASFGWVNPAQSITPISAPSTMVTSTVTTTGAT